MTSGRDIKPKIILFTGAGASAGLGIPTTREFIKVLYSRWTGAEKLISLCLDDLLNSNKIEYKEDLDSELIRDWLINVRDNRATWNKKTDGSLSIDLVAQSIREFDKLIRSAYGTVDPESACNHYLPLLDELARHNISYLPVFSTCYDLTLESINNYNSSDWRVELHRLVDQESSQFENLLKAVEPGQKTLNLYKLHGSTGWKKNNVTGETKYSSTGITETGLADYSDLMIYPTMDNSSLAGEEPFSLYYEIFKNYLNQSEKALCIVIGYSFRDRMINGIFTSAIDKGLRVLVLDNGLEYKQLAGRLGISNIKHRIRIEKMEFGQWDGAKVKLMSDIIRDEIRRPG